MPVPDATMIPQLMRKAHKIRALLDDDLDTARAELCFALQYLWADHDIDGDDDQDDCPPSDCGGP